MYDLSDKTVLVTGASKGIGAAIASSLGAAGAYVVAHYGSDREGAERATAEIAEDRKRLVQADFKDLAAVEKMWEQAFEWRDGIDVLVNNAAIMLWNGGVDESLETWDEVWETTLKINVLAPARLIRRAVRAFKEGDGGAIVTISSWAGQRGVTNPNSLPYGASKATVRALTQSVAGAYARDGILAYIIAPGVVRTRMSEEFAARQGGEEKVSKNLAMGKWVTPEEIAEIVTFLATGRAPQLSGATLDVNGATYIR